MISPIEKLRNFIDEQNIPQSNKIFVNHDSYISILQDNVIIYVSNIVRFYTNPKCNDKYFFSDKLELNLSLNKENYIDTFKMVFHQKESLDIFWVKRHANIYYSNKEYCISYINNQLYINNKLYENINVNWDNPISTIEKVVKLNLFH